MNTLSQDVTRRFFADADGYARLIERWSALTNDPENRKQLRCEHHLLYLVLRGKDWRRSLSPCTNAVKLANGHGRWAPLRMLLRVTSYRPTAEKALEPFSGLLSEEAPDLLRAVLPEIRWDTCLEDLPAYRSAE